MAHLKNILKFGWPYLLRYLPRFVLGVLLGVLFGLSNASFIWATKTMIGRMTPVAPSSLQKAEKAVQTMTPIPAASSRVDAIKVKLEEATDRYLDAWLPSTRRVPDWRQIVGGLLFFPLLISFRGYIGYFS